MDEENTKGVEEGEFEDGEAARFAVKELELADEPPGFDVPGSSLVETKKYGTIHLTKKEGKEGEEWIDTAVVFCGRRLSTDTHKRILTKEWPPVITPRCEDCFNIAPKYLPGGSMCK